MTQLQFEGGGKIAVDTAKITPISSVDVTKTTPRIPTAVDSKFNKLMRAANVASGSPDALLEEAARLGSKKTTGLTSKVLGTTARVVGSLPSLALSFVLGGLFENDAGDGTISGILDSQAYGLLEAMSNGASDEEIFKRQKELKASLQTFGRRLANPATLVLADSTQNELSNLRSMVYARTTGNIFGAKTNLGAIGAAPLSSGGGMGRAGYGEELSALDAIAAQNRLMGISPVVIQDNSVKSSGGNTSVTNQIDSPVQSHDASWYQRRLSMGLGV